MIKIILLLFLTILAGCNSLQTSAQSKEYEPQSLFSAKAIDPALVETRYCGAPKRDAKGVIMRRSDVVTAYKKIHPCPTTGLYGAGTCPDNSLNHIMPLACGGCDSVGNLMYMRNDVKKIVDGYERQISALDPPIEDTAACVNKVQPRLTP
jgi:hypothetical protein